MKTTLCMLVIFALYGLALAALPSDADADESKLKNQANKPDDVTKGSSADVDGQNGFERKIMSIPSDMMQEGDQVAKQIKGSFIGGLESTDRSSDQTKPDKDNPAKAAKDI